MTTRLRAPRPMNAIRIIAIQVRAKLMIDAAAGSYALVWPSNDRYGPNAGRARNVAMVNSPMTMASVRKAPDSRATRTFGRMTKTMLRGQPAPRLWAASVNERMSMDWRPVSIARYMYGNDRTTYAKHSSALLPMSVYVNGSGGWLNVLINPKTSTIGGTTNGSSVMNSTNGRALGTRRRTQKAVGSRSPMLTMIVIVPTTNE